jgi:hypothetical protein
VAWEKRSVSATGGVFEDSFDKFGVHVYRFGECVDSGVKRKF